jgi:NAD(P)H-dependent FMN reductase
MEDQMIQNDSTPRLLAFAGSRRSGSWNRKLLHEALRLAGERELSVTGIELADYPMPLYDGDMEQTSGLPDNAVRLKQLMHEHDGFLIVAPEYNASIPPLLKNTLDWVSRSHDPALGRLEPYRGKLAALLSASPGRFGGMRGLRHLRDVLTTLGVTVLPGDFSLSRAPEAFDERGQLREEHAQRVAGVILRIADMTTRLRMSA